MSGSLGRPNLIPLPDGNWITRDALGIIQQIQEYDENLKVQYLDPSRADDPKDPPYRIMEFCRDGQWRMVFGVWQLDGSVIERLRRADMQRQDLLKAIDDHNAKIQLERNRRYEEKMLEAADIVEHVVKSNKGRYTIPAQDESGETVLIDDTAPSKRIKRKKRRARR